MYHFVWVPGAVPVHQTAVFNLQLSKMKTNYICVRYNIVEEEGEVDLVEMLLGEIKNGKNLRRVRRSNKN